MRLGTPYREYSRALGWLGVSAGVAYIADPGLDPSPSLALAAGADIRLAPPLWLDFSPFLTWTQVIGHDSPFTGPYFSLGFDMGVRFDFVQ